MGHSAENYKAVLEPPYATADADDLFLRDQNSSQDIYNLVWLYYSCSVRI